MIIDTHCHFDMMPNPEQYLKQQEVKKEYLDRNDKSAKSFFIGL